MGAMGNKSLTSRLGEERRRSELAHPGDAILPNGVSYSIQDDEVSFDENSTNGPCSRINHVRSRGYEDRGAGV